jgi:hypothetical protein
MLDSIRGWIGVAPPKAATPAKKPNAVLERRKQAAQEQTHEQRLAALIRAQTVQISQLREDVEDYKEQTNQHLASGNRVAARNAIEARKKVEADIALRQKKLENTRAQQHAIEMANANLEHGLLLQEGAQELKGATEAMAEIDLEGAVDTMQDAAAEVEEHNVLLTEPIFTAGGTVDDGEVDDELNALLAEQADLKAASFPDVPKTAPVKTPLQAKAPSQVEEPQTTELPEDV